jgi:radical SAM-linked protein
VARIRARYTKQGKVRFTGHRDVVRMWERALRRSGLPVAWSEGFSPRPLISFGLALPTGAESLAEYLDIVLTQPVARPPTEPAAALPAGPQDRPDLAAWLSALLPEGIDVQGVLDLPVRTASLQQEVSSCSWELEVLGLSEEELAVGVERLLASPSLLVSRERKGRTVHDDLRPAVLALAVITPTGDDRSAVPGDGRVRLHAELATRPRGVRPRELLQGLGPDVALARACRSHQWIERDGERVEPLELSGPGPGARVPHANERAS